MPSKHKSKQDARSSTQDRASMDSDPIENHPLFRKRGPARRDSDDLVIEPITEDTRKYIEFKKQQIEQKQGMFLSQESLGGGNI